ncbi:MAG: DUF885 family protein [Hyphomonadaceae bacterium]
MHRIALATAFAVAAYAAAPEALAQSRAETQLNQIFADYEAFDRSIDPLTSGSEGDRAALRLLPNVTPEARAAERARLEQFRASLEGVQTRTLPAEAQLNRSFLLRQIGLRLENIALDDDRAPIANDGGFFSLGDYLAYTTPITNSDDAVAWIARLEAMPAYYQQSLANARRGVASGFTQPRIVVERTLTLARAQIETLPTTLLVPLAQMPSSIPAAQQEQYRARARAVVTDRILPAQREVVAFLENEYLPAARAGLGVRSVPGGEDYYRYLVRYYTTTDMTPEEIHALGQSEVARIRAAMEREIEASGFDGTFAEFQNFLRTDPQFYAQSREDLLEKASEIAKRADDQMPRIFGTLPRLPYGIREIPREQEEGSTTAYYSQGSPQLGMAGAYWVNTGRLDQRPLYELPALTLHEAVPGHHQQIAIAQELGELPYFRRNANVTAFSEGWGLYSESLGEDMGIYRTPYERFGRLSYEMWRACRLVADTGIHWLGWDIEQARACFMENSALSPHNIQTELERYIATPGQALAYKIGELTMQRLRAEAEAAHGERFDIRRFHDVLLGAGPLPMNVMEERVRAWIAAGPEAN